MSQQRIDPHRARRIAIVRAHPALTRLMTPWPWTAAWIALLVVGQVAMAAWVATLCWWGVLGASYTVGAVASLALWTLLHETSHDLVFRRRAHNQWLGIFAGLPLAIPAASSFRQCHLLHHRHFGDPVMDGDFAGPLEARLVGASPLRKALWLLVQPLLISVRPGRMPGVRLFDRWFAANLAAQLAFDAAIVGLFGWKALAYLALGNLFALGLHPLGGRWIQEHYLVDPAQKTYSYYGPMNALAFNCGFHVEHHDLMRVPWVHLPTVRRIAREFYEPLHSHRSWSALLLRFLLDRELTLANRQFGPRAESRAAGEIAR